MMQKARQVVVDYYNSLFPNGVEYDDTFIVWFCKTLQNWKALVAINTVSGWYFEITYNGDENVIYLDKYVKDTNEVIKELF